MAKEFKKSSLRDTLLDDLERFLHEEGFISDDRLTKGMLQLVNLVADYYEEGKHLYPEVIVTNDLDGLAFLSPRKVLIKEEKLTVKEFQHALKLCAPLAVDGWVIFIEVGKEQVRIGVMTTEKTETTLSLSRQTKNDDSLPDEATFAHIRCIGQKVVEVVGKKGGIHIYLNLDEEKDLTDNKVESLAKVIVSGCQEDDREKLSIYFEKVIDNALKAGHGNLIGVVEDTPEKKEKALNLLEDGIHLQKEIDLAALIKEAETEKSNVSSVTLRAYTSLMTAMLNHDGITLMTDTGKILGYHLFIKSDQKDEKVMGGARSRAYEAMRKLGLKACFYKSQDGNMKFE